MIFKKLDKFVNKDRKSVKSEKLKVKTWFCDRDSSSVNLFGKTHDFIKMINLFNKTYDSTKVINVFSKTYDFIKNDKFA